MPMQVMKRIKVEVDGSVFYFKPLTMEEAMARKELADNLDSGGNLSEMGKSLADLLLDWENVQDEEGNPLEFDKDTFTKGFTVFQVVKVIKAYLSAIGWSEEEEALPNESGGSSE